METAASRNRSGAAWDLSHTDGTSPGWDVLLVVPDAGPRRGAVGGSRLAQGAAVGDLGDYTAKNITVLEGLDAVRRRPSMYIGSTGPRGLHHLIWEVVDNSVDEALAGRCSTIRVTLLADGGVRVADDGSGIPVDEHPKERRSALEVVMTVLHAGGKFDKQAYAVSGGLHGVGVSVVNALSRRLLVEVRRDGKLWRQEYVRGLPQGPVEAIGEAGDTGTTITFWPDLQIFESVEFDRDTIARRLRDTAFLTAGLRIVFVDQRPLTDDEDQQGELIVEEYYFTGGLKDFVDHIRQMKGKEGLHAVIHFNEEEQGPKGPQLVEIALQWINDYNDSILTFANTINTHEGGKIGRAHV